MTASKPRPVPRRRGGRAAPRDLYSRFIPREELQLVRVVVVRRRLGRRRSRGPPAREAEAPSDPAELLAQQLRAARQAGYQDGYRDGLVALEGFKQSFASQTTTQVGALRAARSASSSTRCSRRWRARSPRRATRAGAPGAAQRARDAARVRRRRRRAGARRAAAERAPHRRCASIPTTTRSIAGGSAEAIAARGARLRRRRARSARGGCRVESDIGLVDATHRRALAPRRRRRSAAS